MFLERRDLKNHDWTSRIAINWWFVMILKLPRVKQLMLGYFRMVMVFHVCVSVTPGDVLEISYTGSIIMNNML